MRIWLTIVAVAFCARTATAQKISQIRVSQEGNDVLLRYNLTGEDGKAYHISLYASHDRYSAPLQRVEGDVGDKRLLPGIDKSIRWRAMDELKNFDGDISFELRAVAAPPLFTAVMASTAKVKRGREVTITWAGGMKENLSVELVKGAGVVLAGNIENTGKLAYTVPKKVKTGTYAITLRQSGETVTGGTIVIKAKYPLWLKLTPIVVGVAVWQLLPDSTEDEFPEPPDLTGGQ